MSWQDFLAPFGIALQSYGIWKDRKESVTSEILKGPSGRLLWRVRISVAGAVIMPCFLITDVIYNRAIFGSSFRDTLFTVFLLLGLVRHLIQLRRERDAFRMACVREVMES
jgi:hypothetical protein